MATVKQTAVGSRPPKISLEKAVAITKLVGFLSKQIAFCRIMALTRGFHTWRCSRSYGHSDQVADRESVNDKRESNYLIHFAENEKLREQLNELRKSMRTKETSIRTTGSTAIITIWFRSRLRAKKRFYFDRWFYTTHHLKDEGTLKHKSIQYEGI